MNVGFTAENANHDGSLDQITATSGIPKHALRLTTARGVTLHESPGATEVQRILHSLECRQIYFNIYWNIYFIFYIHLQGFGNSDARSPSCCIDTKYMRYDIPYVPNDKGNDQSRMNKR